MAVKFHDKVDKTGHQCVVVLSGITFLLLGTKTNDEQSCSQCEVKKKTQRASVSPNFDGVLIYLA